ncbi:MAG TPA: hypothetical protein VJQ43_03605 [Thermoplasmata archaeon]|nr:hypothetical protein [Thermoplasmata archaeon]
MDPTPARSARPPTPNNLKPALSRKRPWLAAGFVTLALAVLVVPGAFPSATPVIAGGSHLAPAVVPSPGPSESWAWGAMANFSASVQYVGAYNNSQNLTGGNLTSSGASVALDESVGLQYGAYVVVNASTPSNGTRYVQVSAAELRAEHVAIAASGTFPVAGNYTPNASIPLRPTNFSLGAAVEVLQVAAAFLNFTIGPNGSLSLANEHVEVAEGINVSLAAHQFPNVTRDSAGDLGIRYVTASIRASAWLVEDLSAVFSPALTLVDGPLFVGKTWNATSQAHFTGSSAWAETVHYVSPSGATASASNSGTGSANATVPVNLACAVDGTTTVRYPNGTAETDDVIACANATGSPTYLTANGLIVLPRANQSGASAALVAAVPERPAAAPASPAAQAKGATLYSPTHRFATSERATPASGDAVTATPMTPSAARSAMHALGAPVRPEPVAWQPPVALVLGVMVASGIGALGLVVVLARREQRRRIQ